MLRNTFLVGICAAFAFAVQAQSASTAETNQVKSDSRPTIGVVLAGGGAKGAAHIGVLKALEEMRIPVDIITGTSMGSYVGGLYATGQSADQIKGYLTTVDWNSGYRDQVNRSDRRLRDKEYEDRYQLNTDLGVGMGTIKTPKGVVQGQGMLRILRETSRNPPAIDSFDNMAIRYRAVATDIVELEEVVIDKGYLVDAMMASMSVPGALPPYEVNGRMLVDGGVVNNMPVDLAKDMGADYIIAVDISSNYKSKEELRSFLDVGGQLSNYLVQRGTLEKAKLLTADDTYLKPEVGTIGTTDFSAMPEAYELGYEAAMANRDKLMRYSLSEEEYAAYTEHKALLADLMVMGDEIPIEAIEVQNQSHYNPEILSHRLDLRVDEQPTPEEIEEGITRLYALDRFEKITYRVEQREHENAVVVSVDEKDWGPNYLNFRFYLEDDFTTESKYGLGASINFTDLSRQGAELRTNLELGTDKLISADLYSPFFANQLLFNTLTLKYTDEGRNVALASITGDIDDLSQTKDYIPVTYKQFVADLGIGLQPALWNEVKVGLRYTIGEAELSTLPSVGNSNFERKALYARYLHDTLDSLSFPTRGSLVYLEYISSFDSVEEQGSTTEEDERVDEYKMDLVGAATFFEKHTLVATAELGLFDANNSGAVPIDPYDLGGFQNLSGIPRNSLIGQNKAFTKLVYRYQWFENDFGMFQSPVYLGGSVEYGGVWTGPDKDIGDAPMFVAGSLFAGIDSPVGPVILGYGHTEDGMGSVYLIIGTAFK
ncbi:patatin-like phospholipase family protein [Vibrio comitans]|uniref:Serine protease n=1 Tax=Vibrio comitans NBRC 102076 TaxID=1219078 RepID=A0A4Y3ILW6_9VIBR|nr:patatin-like phospholipase family protein [Vibrio comitans]GEA59710.1 serine protease [Vibrio comitans NBRC 102076]